ncbi:MAG TPA: 4-alpha-glucanotransferase [Bacteroidetes bacterium]|nr:4-alpha-glucanotransferase [Bacteroidota bacterium]HRR07173.1 4-alpha-glucanotransferase [Rhodothermales bacterium]
MAFPRASGVLLHVSSLPDSPGIGDLGKSCDRFLDFLHKAGQRYWQILPLGPTGYGDSPYQCFSAFAGNPLLVSPERLIADGLLKAQPLEGFKGDKEDRVDFGKVVLSKKLILRESFDYFMEEGTTAQKTDFEAFCAQYSSWLDDFSLFMAIKNDLGGKAWWEWPLPLKLRDPAALAGAKERLSESVQLYQYQQWVFFSQWARVKQRANAQGIEVIGDLPIFVARDSAEAWAKPALFYFDAQANPTIVAGVPPDYFSETGQLWGNPLYRWDKMAEDGYQWWIERFRALLDIVDIIRIDHFRGFAEYWAVPGGDETAVNGKWEKGPGTALFQAVLDALGKLPIMAEDLGLMTPSVHNLRDHFSFPGMHILQFAFALDIGATSEADLYPHLPHRYKPNSVTYTGTHDNNTTKGWWQKDATEAEKRKFCEYLNVDGSSVVWDLIQTCFFCPSDTAIVPMQDLLALDEGARMNFPGHPSGNWQWRAKSDAFSDDLARSLRELTETAGRLNKRA